MSTRAAAIAFRKPVRPAGDVPLFEHALTTLRGAGRHGGGELLAGRESPAAVLLTACFLVLVVALGAALAFRAITIGSAPASEPTRAPSDFTVRVEGAAAPDETASGRFMLATVAIDEGVTHAADADMQKVLRDGPELMREAKRLASDAAAACLGHPVRARIDAGRVIGASGGLMFALGIIDQATPGDLTGGRSVAGTGAVSADGRVGPVLSMQEKIVGAERAGAALFLVPTDQLAEAEGYARAMRVVGVANLADALAALDAGVACVA